VGLQEDADRAWESYKNRSNAQGKTVMRNRVIYHPDGTTTSVRPEMGAAAWKGALASPRGGE
jgi:hypothetical protein